MKKQKYLSKLLDLCASHQLEIFNSNFPNGPVKGQIKDAILNVEALIIYTSNKYQQIVNANVELAKTNKYLTMENKQLVSELADVKNKLREANIIINSKN